MSDRLICPCCGKHHFLIQDDYEICPVCGWEDDSIQRNDPDYEGGANRLSLNQARDEYIRSGYAECNLYHEALSRMDDADISYICSYFQIDKDTLFSLDESQLDEIYDEFYDILPDEQNNDADSGYSCKEEEMAMKLFQYMAEYRGVRFDEDP